MPRIATTQFLHFYLDKYESKCRKKNSGPAFQRFLRKFIFISTPSKLICLHLPSFIGKKKLANRLMTKPDCRLAF